MFLVIAYLLLYYHVGNRITLSEHLYFEFMKFHIHLNLIEHIWDVLKRREMHL